MSRYIDAEKELKELKDMKVEGEVFTTAVNFAIKVIEEAPSIDIVRCRECKYTEFCEKKIHRHGISYSIDFCSRGEREGE